MQRLLPFLVLAILALAPAAAQAQDNDKMPTAWEKRYGLNPNKNDGRSDKDRDRLSNYREWQAKTNPRKKDSDGDKMADGFEVENNLNPRLNDAGLDPDGDGFDNFSEYQAQTSPRDKNSTPKKANPVAPQPTGGLNQNAGRGVFVVNCARTERKPLDPIIFPGQPGRSHMHDFFGPKTVSDDSLPNDLINEPTSCALSTDRSAYWMPTLYNDGQLQEGDQVQAYYFIDQKTKPFPRGLMMLAGKPSLTVSDPQSASWSCQPSNDYGKTTLPPCPQGNYILSEVRFPACWDGKSLDSSDHRSHMAYRTDAGCPSSHPVELPELVLFRTFTQYNGLLDKATLASGATGGLHADFVSGWDEAAMQQLINRCYDKSCGAQADSAATNAVKPATVFDKSLFCRLAKARQ